MKTKFGLKPNLRLILSYVDLLRFSIHKILLGFESANNFMSIMSKSSIQFVLKRYGATIGDNCDIETGLIFHNCEDYKNLVIGNNCHIGKNCFFDLRDKIIIKNNVCISMLCAFITHIDIHKSDLSIFYPTEQKPIIINNNCVLGIRSTVLMGVEIGENSIISAEGLITRDIFPNMLVGSPRTRSIKMIDMKLEDH